ncbi:MAG: hypothetical protein AB8G15_11175 [Saprospiraceae bacterium]
MDGIDGGYIPKVELSNQSMNFFWIDDACELEDEQVLHSEAIVLNCESDQSVLHILHKLRHMNDKRIYLKPIFLNNRVHEDYIVQQTDGVLDENPIERIIEKAFRINILSRDVGVFQQNQDYHTKLLLKTLQYLYTRNTTLHPTRTRKVKIAYAYPYLNSLIEDKESYKTFDLLLQATQQGFLKPILVDKINLCSNCHGSYLNFREACPKCQSIDLEVVDIIHHFRCANVAPVSDYMDGENLHCPKCDKTLRHIGIDYDKPSEIFHCQSCDHRTQDLNMKALCVDCGTENTLDILRTQTVMAYEITAAGKDLALNGLIKLDETSLPLTGDHRIVNWINLEIVFNYEKEKSKLQTGRSKMGVIQIQEAAFRNLDPDTQQKVNRELLLILHHYLRSIDVLSSKNLWKYVFLLPEISEADAKAMQEMMQYNIHKLLSHNIDMDDNFLSIQIHDIGPDSQIPIF